MSGQEALEIGNSALSDTHICLELLYFNPLPTCSASGEPEHFGCGAIMHAGRMDFPVQHLNKYLEGN